MRLAGEHESRVDLALLQREMLIHLDAAADQPGTAGAADAALARVWSVRANAQRGIEDSLAIRVDGEGRAAPVENDRDLRRAGDLRRGRELLGGARRAGRTSAWNSSACTWSASTPRSSSTVRADSIISRGPQRNHSSTPAGGTSSSRNMPSRSASMRPWKSAHLLLLAREHVVQSEPLRVLVLQVLELLEEHDVA